MTDKFNYYVKKNIPFLFIIDFDQTKPVIIPIAEAEKQNIFFWINSKTNYNKFRPCMEKITVRKYPISYEQYKTGFDIIYNNLRLGNSYLANLTYPTKIEIELTLEEIFQISSAKYKLFFKDTYVSFSPESFVKIKDGKIYSYPMKGTIDASLPNAENVILNDEKETAEHVTIVDLIRNDLGIISKKVEVTKYRFIDKIYTSGKTLLQVSSEIVGELYDGYQKNLGEIIYNLLPAGSVTGAPKKKTVEIIKEAEKYDRGYYTGIFGYYENGFLDSGVTIRFIEKIGNDFYYKSGGGITIYSDPEKEYNELKDKIYVPIS